MNPQLYIAITDAFDVAMRGDPATTHPYALLQLAREMADRIHQAYPLFDRAAFLRDCGLPPPAELDQRYREAEGYQEEQLPW